MTLDLFQTPFQYIERYAGQLRQEVKNYSSQPETGFREWETVAHFLEVAKELGLEVKTGLARTGAAVRLRGGGEIPEGRRRPAVLWIAELDAILCPRQLHWPVSATGATHACGHAIQMAVMTEGLRFFSQKEILEKLSGDIVFLAVPAEEMIELEFRLDLLKKGEISALSGKQALILDGFFDNIDMALMFHALPDRSEDLVLQSPALGFISKEVIFHGKATHAAGAPEQGINALHAANLAWQAVQCLREGFRDEDRIRVHGIMTQGGLAVNVIPDRIEMEWVVRAKDVERLKETNRKVNRAIRYSAMAVGAEAEVIDRPGYLPMEQAEELNHLIARRAKKMGWSYSWGDPFPGSTDMGDLCQILPLVQVSVGGYAAPLHSEQFRIVDEEKALYHPFQILTSTILDLLSEGGREAQRIMLAHPRRETVTYRKLWEEILQVEDPR